MRILRIILFTLLMPLATLAQKINISGKVTAADTKAALAGASVFLSSSSVGTSTANDGAFNLSLNPGQYTLVVSALGYETSMQTVLVSNQSINLDIVLAHASIELKEVKISPMSNSDRKKALARFKTEFLGTGPNADDCKIKNPDVLSFSYAQNKAILQASTADFLVVENNALGYTIKFMLKSYESNLFTGDIVYKGSRVFEEMKGGNSKTQKWHKKRDEAYFGSAMHFYRALTADSLESAGFKIYRLTRVANAVRPSDEEIDNVLTQSSKLKRDSVLFWMGLKEMSRYANQKFKGKFLVADILQQSEKPGLFGLHFPDHLYVQYTKKWETNYYKDVYRSKNDLNYATTIVTMPEGARYIVLDKNGTITGEGPYYEGAWSQQRISNQLPVDYVPYSKQP